MASDSVAGPDLAYPYHGGWRMVGCGVLMFGALGGIGVALLPLGYEQVQGQQMPLGILMMLGGLFAIPVLVMAFLTLLGGIRNEFHPPLLRVTPTGLLLPKDLRGEPPPDDDGVVVPGTPPPHPEWIPFAAIRSVKREGPRNTGSDRLVIVHDLAPVELVIRQHMMNAADFEALEALLRAAVPASLPVERDGPPVA